MWSLSEGPNGGDLVVGLAAIFEDPKADAQMTALALLSLERESMEITADLDAVVECGLDATQGPAPSSTMPRATAS